MTPRRPPRAPEPGTCPGTARGGSFGATRPLPEPGAQRIDRDVDVDDLIGALEDEVGHGLANLDARGARDGVVERFEVLDVDGGDDGDARIEQREHILIAFGVRRAGSVGMGEFVDDRDRGPAGEHGVEVHLCERHAAIRNLLHRQAFEIADQRVELEEPLA